jgi:transposase-like protein
MEERGGPIAHATIQRGVVQDSPLLDEAFHRRQRPVWVSWRMDETDIKIKGPWYDLDRAVEKTGQTIDLRLTAQRDEQAAKRLLTKASHRHGVPEKSTIDRSAAQEAAIRRYHEEHGTAIALRKSKYLTHIVEQDPRGVKRVTRPRLGCKSFAAAQDTWVGIERMHMSKKRPLVVEEGDEGRTVLCPGCLSPTQTGATTPSYPPEQNWRQSCHAPQGHHESCKWGPQGRNLQGSR